jgi:hypothetical protein
VLIIRRALADVPGTAQLALTNLEEQFQRLEEQLETYQETLERIGWHELSALEARDAARAALNPASRPS